MVNCEIIYFFGIHESILLKEAQLTFYYDTEVVFRHQQSRLRYKKMESSLV